jgi:hypothetical protein
MFNGVSTNGASNLVLQLGTSSGIETTGYAGGFSAFSASTVSSNSVTANITVYSQATAADVASGLAVICLVGSNTWATSGTMGASVPRATTFGFTKTLAGTLDRVRITANNGTDTFDAGTINIMWE